MVTHGHMESEKEAPLGWGCTRDTFHHCELKVVLSWQQGLWGRTQPSTHHLQHQKELLIIYFLSQSKSIYDHLTFLLDKYSCFFEDPVMSQALLATEENLSVGLFL